MTIYSIRARSNDSICFQSGAAFRTKKPTLLLVMMIFLSMGTTMLMPLCLGFQPVRSWRQGKAIQKPKNGILLSSSSQSNNETSTVTVEAVRSMETCYTAVGASALIDLASFLYQTKQRNLLSLTSNVDLLRISAKVAFFWGIFWAGRLVKDLPATSASEGSIIQAMKIMANLWLRTAIFIVLASGLHVSQLFNLKQTENLLLATFCAALAVLVRVFSLPGVEKLSTVSAVQSQGRRTVESMSFCAAALLLHGSVKLWDSWSSPVMFARIFRLIGSATPFRVALKLATLRLALTEAVSAWPQQGEVRDRLANAQLSFYSEVGKTYRHENILKVAMTAVALLKGFLHDT